MVDITPPNPDASSQLETRSRAQLLQELTRLQQTVADLHAEKMDLEIMMETLVEHGDTMESLLRDRNAEIDRLNSELAQTNQTLQKLANCDGLTGIANRRYFSERLASEWQRLSRESGQLSLVLCDIDFFKRYNDTYGHQAGDRCLRKVAKALRSAANRSVDLAARYGGEEFVLVLPDMEATAAWELAERVRQTIRQLSVPHAGSSVERFVTLSFGVATVNPQLAFSPDLLVAAADRALYLAKEQGRDRVVLAPSPILATPCDCRHTIADLAARTSGSQDPTESASAAS